MAYTKIRPAAYAGTSLPSTSPCRPMLLSVNAVSSTTTAAAAGDKMAAMRPKKEATVLIQKAIAHASVEAQFDGVSRSRLPKEGASAGWVADTASRADVFAKSHHITFIVVIRDIVAIRVIMVITGITAIMAIAKVIAMTTIICITAITAIVSI